MVKMSQQQEEGKPQCTGLVKPLLMSLANVPSVKTSHLTKLRVIVHWEEWVIGANAVSIYPLTSASEIASFSDTSNCQSVKICLLSRNPRIYSHRIVGRSIP